MKKIIIAVLAVVLSLSLVGCKKEPAQKVEAAEIQQEKETGMNLVVREFEDLVMDIEREIRFSGTISVELVNNSNSSEVLVVNQIKHYYSYDVWVPDTVRIVYFDNTSDFDGIMKFTGNLKRLEGESKYWSACLSSFSTDMRMVKFNIVPCEAGYIVLAEYWPTHDAMWRRDKKGYTPENILILKRYI